MIVMLKNEKTGQMEGIEMGFNVAAFFLGGFLPMFKGQIGYGIVTLLLSIITCGVWWFIFAFKYGKNRAQHLLLQGYLPTTDQEKDILRMNGVIVPN